MPDKCKCPGQGTTSEEYAYYLKFCVTSSCVTNVVTVKQFSDSKVDSPPRCDATTGDTECSACVS
ncbi:MAG: hypothetical protein V9G04_03070 [Nocardioides sp.]